MTQTAAVASQAGRVAPDVAAPAGRVRPSTPGRERRQPADGELDEAATAALYKRYGPRLGSFPTILSAVAVSHKEQDIAFAQAAARGDVDELRRLLPLVTSVDVRCRANPAKHHNGRPMTPLHWAASAGAIDAASLLLEAGADPSARMEWLRSLTPLHVAVTVPMARRLLYAGASPVALDPRERAPHTYKRIPPAHASI